MRVLTTNPLIPATLWATLAVLSGAALLAYLLIRPPRISRTRRAVVGALLAIGLAGMLTILLNPTWEELDRAQLGRPVLAVLLDSSGSMETIDAGGIKRLEAQKKLARQFCTELGDSFDVRLWQFDTQLRPISDKELDSLEAKGIATDIGTCVATALRSELGEEAALVVVSDGIHNVAQTLSEVHNAARSAKAMAVPIFTKTLGSDAVVEDLRLKLVTPDDVAFVRQEVPVRALVENVGLQAGRAEVTLREGNNIVASRTVGFSGGEPGRVEFEVKKDEPGVFRYVLEVTPLPAEIVRANNRAVFYLRVTDQPIRVLILEGKPYWDFKFLMRELADDAGFSPIGAVQVKPGRVILREVERAKAGSKGKAEPEEKVKVIAGGGKLLESFDEMKDYQILILGRDAEAFLTPQAVKNLRRWLAEWGGALVCARGRPVQVFPEQLEALMPVRWRIGKEVRFRIHMAKEAEWAGWLPWGAALMPSLATGATIEEVKPLASVLARADPESALKEMAVVTFQQYGSGRVVILEGSGQWRWAFGSAAAEDPHAQMYAKFWNNLLRWLAASADFLPGQTAALRSSAGVYTTLESVSLQLLVRDDPEIKSDSAPVIELSEFYAGGEKLTLRAAPKGDAPGLFFASCDPLPAGSYVARLARRGQGHPVQCAFEVTVPTEERLDLRARPSLMERLAHESGGAVLGGNPTEQIKVTYTEYWQARHPEQIRRRPAWDRLAFMAGLVALMSAVWLVRRRGGLI